MTAFFNRLFNIKTEEWSRLLMLYAMFFVFMVGTVWGGTVVEASFLTQVGLEFLPTAFVVEAFITGIAIAIYSVFVDRVPNDRLLVMILIFSIFVVIIGRVILALGYETIAYPILYLFYLMIIGLFPLQWWNYIDEFYDTITAKRTVPIIASGLQVGTIFAGITLPFLNRTISPDNVIIGWAIALIIVILLINNFTKIVDDDIADNIEARTTDKMPYLQSMREGFGYIRNSSFLLWMSANTLFLTLMVALISYESNEILLSELQTTERLSNFLGALQSAANFIMLPIQVFVFSRIVRRIGVEDTNLIYPAGSLLIIGSLLFSPVKIVAGALGIFGRSAFRRTFQTPVEILMYNTIPLRVKGRIGAVIAGIVQPAGTLLGGILLIAILPIIEGSAQLALLTALVGVGYLLISIILRRQYVRALLDTLENEDFSFLLNQPTEVNIVDATTINKLSEKLKNTKSEELTLFLAQLLCQAGQSEAIPVLEDYVRNHESLRIRRGMLDIMVATDIRSERAGILYRDLLSDDDAEIRRAAAQGLEAILTRHNIRFLNTALQLVNEDDSLIVRTQVMPALISSGDIFYMGSAFHQLSNMLISEDVQARIGAVRVLQRIDDVRMVRNLIDVMQDADDEVRLASAFAMEHLSQFDVPEWMYDVMIEEIELLLTDNVERIRQAAILIVKRIDYLPAYETLFLALFDESKLIRKMAIETIAKAGSPIMPKLGLLLEQGTSDQKRNALIAMVSIDRETYKPAIMQFVFNDLAIIYLNHTYLAAVEPFADKPGVSVLEKMLDDQNRDLLDNIYYLLGAVYGHAEVGTIAKNIDIFDSRPFAAEALEAMTDNNFLAENITALYDHKGDHKTIALRQHDSIPSIGNVVRSLSEKGVGLWWRMVAIYIIGELHQELGENLYQPILDDALSDENEQVKRSARAAQRLINPDTQLEWSEGTMLSNLEKVIFLKQVPLFNGLSVEELKLVAGISKEKIFERGTVLFKEGDPGDAMYIIVNGNLAVELEDSKSGKITRLATRSSYEFIGEMALFDREPRSADVRAITDTLTLRIEDNAFMRLTRQTPDLAIGIIRVLSSRIRESATQLAEMQSGKSKEVLNVFDRLGELADKD